MGKETYTFFQAFYFFFFLRCCVAFLSRRSKRAGAKRGKEITKQERKLTSARQSFYTLAGRSRGSTVCAKLSDFQKAKNELQQF